MKESILVVEDNQTNLELLSDWLEAKGFDVCGSENLEQAFALLGTHAPHAILLDVQLGSEDGLTLATWVRHHQNLGSIPIIAVTAHAMVTDHERVLRAGCNACIPKPIDFSQLDEQLRQWPTLARVLSHKNGAAS